MYNNDCKNQVYAYIPERVIMKTSKDKIKIIAVALLVCAALFGTTRAGSKTS